MGIQTSNSRSKTYPTHHTHRGSNQHGGDNPSAHAIRHSNRREIREQLTATQARIRVPDARAARAIRDGRSGEGVQQRRDGAQDIHGLAGPGRAVVAARGPHEPAGPAVGPARALPHRGLGRRLEYGQEHVGREGRQLRRLRHPPVVVALEAEHVRRAALVLLAGGLERDAVREEPVQRVVDEAADPLLPRRCRCSAVTVRARVVVHVRGS